MCRRVKVRSWALRLNNLILACLLLTSATLAQKSRNIKSSYQRIGFEQRLEAETLLTNLGYWTGPVDGVLDPAFRHALVAFQKVEGRKRTGVLSALEIEALRKAERPEPREIGLRHVEIDIDRQVLFIVEEGGVISRILPACTGNEGQYIDQGKLQRAHTPRGKFRVLRQIRGVRISTLGFLYYPNYIHNGIAIHGSPSMPAHPASHGCIRIPMFAAKELSALMPIGTEVIVYD